MSITLKKSQFMYKDSQTGQYVSIDAVSEKAAADYISEINGVGQQNITALENKGSQVRDSIPSDYTAFQNGVIDEFAQANNYPAGKYVRSGDYFYNLTNGHEAGVTIENTTKRQIVVTNELANLQSAIMQDQRYNDLNLLFPFSAENKTVKDVQFTWNGYRVTFYGTCSGSGNYELYYDETHLPNGIVAGGTYHVIYSSTNMSFRVYSVKNGSLTEIFNKKTSGNFTVPSDAEGMVMRFKLQSDVVYNETVDLPFVYSDMANMALKAYYDEYLSKYAPTYQDMIVGEYGADRKPTIIKTDSTTFSVSFNNVVRAVWNGGSKIGTNVIQQTYSVGNGDVLVYYPATDVFDVVAGSQIVNISNQYGIVLYNAHGNLLGQWAHYYYDSITDARITWLEANVVPAVPSYYETQMATKVATINGIADDLDVRSVRFIWITDYHQESNANNSPALINRIMKRTGIRKIAFGGDAIDGETTKEAGFNKICEFLNRFLPLEGKADIFYNTGNHEYNNPSANQSYLDRMPSRGAIFSVFNDPNDKIVCLENTNSFYYDDQNIKIRYYFIDCNYGSGITYEAMHSINQSFYTVPEGYAVILFSHRSFNTGSTTEIYTRLAQIMKCAEAMDAGITTSVYEGTVVSYDFTGKQRDFICAFGGHSHKDGYVIDNDKYPMIATTCDGYGVDTTLTREAGTVTEQAFDVIQIDTSTKHIYLTRIGAGDDREFTYGENAGPVT